MDNVEEVSKDEKLPLAAVDKTAGGKGTVTGYWWQHITAPIPVLP